MAFVKGSTYKARPALNRAGSIMQRKKYKADYRPKEKYSTSTKKVGGFVLHEVQVVSPSSSKSSADKENKLEEEVSDAKENTASKKSKENESSETAENSTPTKRIKSPKSPLDDSELLYLVTKKKRGRPRKNPINSSVKNCVSNSPPVDEDTFNSEILAQLSPPQEIDHSSANPISWSPLQRLFQLNQALACVEHYRDETFWDKIFAEFFNPDGRFRLVLGDGKTYDLPSFAAGKLFWIWAQCGLERLNFCWDSIAEVMNEDGSIQVNCEHARVCSYSENNAKHMVQQGSQYFVFTFSSKLREFLVKIENFFEYSATKNSATQFGFDNSILLFLEVASVMTSVLPDCVSWLTWFQSYCQQNSYISSNSLSLAHEAQRIAEENQALFTMDIPSLESPAFTDFADINLNSFMGLNESIDIPIISDKINFGLGALESASINDACASTLEVVCAAAEVESLIEQRVENRPESGEPVQEESGHEEPVQEESVHEESTYEESEHENSACEEPVDMLSEEQSLPEPEPVPVESLLEETLLSDPPITQEDDDFFDSYL